MTSLLSLFLLTTAPAPSPPFPFFSPTAARVRLSQGTDQETKVKSDLTDEQIFRMGLSKYTEYYTKRAKSDSILVSREACYDYAERRRKDNTARIKRLHTAAAKRMQTLSDALDEWEGTCLALRRNLEGGGSIYLDFNAYALANRRAFLGVLLRLPNGSAPMPAKRRQAERTFAHCRRALAKLVNGKHDSLFDADRFKKEVDTFRKETSALQTAVRNLSDDFAGRTAVYMEDALKLLDEALGTDAK